MTFWRAFYLGPVALRLTKNIIRLLSSWICVLAEFRGMHYIPHLLKHRSEDPEQSCRLHLPRKYMQIVMYSPLSAYTALPHNTELALKELFPSLTLWSEKRKKEKKIVHILSFVVCHPFWSGCRWFSCPDPGEHFPAMPFGYNPLSGMVLF